MTVIGRIGSFLAGGLFGAAVGAAAAMLIAPQSGKQFQREIEQRFDQARVAGLEAQRSTEEELIRRFRAETNDPDALRDEETQMRVEAAQAIADLGLLPTTGTGPAASTA
jgi:gas vesicle protein